MKNFLLFISFLFVSFQVIANPASSMNDWQFDTDSEGSLVQTVLFLGGLFVYLLALNKICILFCNTLESAKKVITVFTWGVNALLFILITLNAKSFTAFFVLNIITTFFTFMIYSVSSDLVFKEIEERERLKEKGSM